MEFNWDTRNEFNDYNLNSLKISALSKEIQKNSRSLYNRIQSIISDSEFVKFVSDIYPQFPLVGKC